jgi:hypothetical protein
MRKGHLPHGKLAAVVDPAVSCRWQFLPNKEIKDMYAIYTVYAYLVFDYIW